MASASESVLPTLGTVSLERDGHVLLIGLNRPHKRNAFDRAMLVDLSRAYGVLESDPSVRAGVLYAQDDHFTHLARDHGDAAAIERLRPAVAELFASQDAAEGVQSFVERRPARFHGR